MKKKSIQSLPLRILAICLVLLSSANFVFAQSDLPTDVIGLSISPLVFELNADPGDTLTNQIKVFNPTGNATEVKIGVEDFTPIGEQGEVVLSEPDNANSTFSIASWTISDPEQFVLKPGEQKIVTFKINVPRNAEPGGHYGSIVAKISGGSNSVSGSSVGSKRGALILVRISGQIEENISVDTFTTKSLVQNGPIDFALKFKNNGNVHLKPAGFITITDMFGNQVDQISFAEKNVIPESVRDVSTSWDKQKLFGRYTANLVASYGSNEKQVITESLVFTVFPVKKALIILAVVSPIALLLYLKRKRLGKAFKVLFSKQ